MRGLVGSQWQCFSVFATYWAAWCESLRRHPLQCWGRETYLSKSPQPAAPHVAMFPSQNQSVLPWRTIPFTLRTNTKVRGAPCSSAPGHGTWPRLWRGVRETYHSCLFGGASSIENKWRASSPPGESSPGYEYVTGVAWTGSRRCLKGNEEAADLAGPRCWPRRWERPHLPCVAAWIYLF